MKKTYQQPTVAETDVRLESAILDASIVWDDENNTGTGGLIDKPATGPAMGRRHFNVWDDPED